MVRLEVSTPAARVLTTSADGVDRRPVIESDFAVGDFGEVQRRARVGPATLDLNGDLADLRTRRPHGDLRESR